MSRPVGKRPLQFEKLELRAMLAGNVLVSIVDGDLRVDGDDQSNVLQFRQLADSKRRPDSEGLSFRLTPDADTSINGGDPGTEVVVSGVTGDILVAMGGGGDKVSFLGSAGRQVQDLVIDSGDGPDAVRITRFEVRGDIRVAAADSVDVSVARSTGNTVSVNVENTDRESKDGAERRTSSVNIRNSSLRRSVNLSSDGPLSVDTGGVSIGVPDVCKVPAPPAPPIPTPFPCGNLNISSSASVSADINRVRAFDLFVTRRDVEGGPNNQRAASTSDITIRNSDLHRSVQLSSDGPLEVNTRGVTIGFPDVCKVPAPPAPYVPVPFPCGSLSISSGAPVSADIHRTQAFDVFVTMTGADGNPQDGTAASTNDVTIRNSNLRQSVNLSSDGPLKVNTRGVSIGLPDVCKVPAPPAPPVPIPYPCGSLEISSGAPLSADIHRTRAFDLIVTTTNAEGPPQDEAAASTVTIRNSNFRRDVKVSSDGPLSVNIARTKANGDLSIQAAASPKSNDLRGADASNSIRVIDSVFGSLTVIGSKSRDEVRLVRLRVLGESHIDLGGGNDSLTAVDSLFEGFAVLDGGADEDLLTLIGTRFRRGSHIDNWE